jgi:hypothetical protein
MDGDTNAQIIRGGELNVGNYLKKGIQHRGWWKKR